MQTHKALTWWLWHSNPLFSIVPITIIVIIMFLHLANRKVLSGLGADNKNNKDWQGPGVANTTHEFSIFSAQKTKRHPLPPGSAGSQMPLQERCVNPNLPVRKITNFLLWPCIFGQEAPWKYPTDTKETKKIPKAVEQGAQSGHQLALILHSPKPVFHQLHTAPLSRPQPDSQNHTG